MIKQLWYSTPLHIKLLASAPALAYVTYKLGLELWCVAYGFGMALGLL